MARATKSRSKTVVTRKRHSDEFKREALGLAEKIGVNEAARELGLHSSQLYGWRSKAELVKTRGQVDQDQAREIARLKRQRRERTVTPARARHTSPGSAWVQVASETPERRTRMDPIGSKRLTAVFASCLGILPPRWLAH